MSAKLKSDVADRVIELVADHLGAERDRVTPEAHFIKELGADSLDVVELIMTLEEEFGIAISDADTEMIQTVGEAIGYVERVMPPSRESSANRPRGKKASDVIERRAAPE
ncbi:acyl carrier protein (plasmid) [Sphingobium xenophagum]|nr:acyl carrier protein [Sphingobium xenophagum]